MNKVFLLVLSALAVVGCDINQDEVAPSNTFTKIFDDSRFEQEYYPIDIVQTSDNGFLILSEKKTDQSLFTKVHIMKVDELGNVVNNVDLNDPYANAVGGWQQIGSQYFFVCMDGNSLTGQLIEVAEDGTPGTPIAMGGITYPLVVNKDGNDLVVLSYDNSNAESVISVVSITGSVINQQGYTIGAGVDVEKPIIDHITRNGDLLPFAVGKTVDGVYYFNGLFNYTFSLVFSNFGGSPVGVSQGQLSQGGISAIETMGSGTFGIARFNFGANYLTPNASISTSSITSSTDIGGNVFPEIEDNARVKIMEVGTNMWLYATNTQNRQVVLYGFEQGSGAILGTEYLGDGSPYKLASVTTTSDGGLAILAETALEGRFPRIALFKRDADYLLGLLE